ncbi:MAG: hypothetical protein IPI35_10110 [Deltaproteobacteria bacterium]|nr:hypothetical protein [Deltaproteobacteria bacterium]
MLRSIAVSLVLLSCSPSVWAGEGGAGAPADAPTTAEPETPPAHPRHAPPQDGSPVVFGGTQTAEGVAVDPGAEPLDPEAAKALEALQGEVAAPDAPPPMNLDWMYQDGATAGAEDAKIAAGYGIHALAGLASGLVCGPCGCIGAPAVELLVSPGVPAGVWQGYDSTYQRGYIDSYRRTTRQRRAVYAAVGATVGATATVAAGLAFQIYGDLL